MILPADYNSVAHEGVFAAFLRWSIEGEIKKLIFNDLDLIEFLKMD